MVLLLQYPTIARARQNCFHWSPRKEQLAFFMLSPALMHTSDCVVKGTIASGKQSTCWIPRTLSSEAVVDHSHRPPVADCSNAILLFVTQCDANSHQINNSHHHDSSPWIATQLTPQRVANNECQQDVLLNVALHS